MLDFTNKEFVRSFIYSNFKHDRRMIKDEVIFGRVYTKQGIACATTMVCDLWKVYDPSVERFKYVYMAGVARQHPSDICVKYKDGVEIAHEKALTEPVLTLIYDKPVEYEFIEHMMEAYVYQLPKQMIKTKRELECEEYISSKYEEKIED